MIAARGTAPPASAPSSTVALSIVIPMYQERDRIGGTLADVCATLRAWGIESEVLLVDDGSTDGTHEAVTGFFNESETSIPSVRLLRHAKNRGKGAAVRTGLAAARGNWVLMMDADNATRLVEVTKLVSAASRPTGPRAPAIVIGSRVAPGADIKTSWMRRCAGRLFHACLVVLGLNLARDTQCGFKLYRADAARYMALHAQEDGFSFDVEHLLLARRAGFSVREVGVRWEHREGGSISVGRDGIKMLRAAWAVRRRIQGTSPAAPEPVVPAATLGALIEIKPLQVVAGATGA